MIAVIARLFAFIMVMFAVIAAVFGGLAYFKTRKFLGRIRDGLQGADAPPHATDSKVIDGEYKVLGDDEKG